MATAAYIDGAGLPASGQTITSGAINGLPIPVAGTGAFETGGGIYKRIVAITMGLPAATGDTGYPSGGYPLTPAQFGLSSILKFELLSVNTAGIAYVYAWDDQAKTLNVSSAFGTPVTPGTDISGVTCGFEVSGI